MNQAVRPTISAPAPHDLRKTLSNFATGVAIITTTDENGKPFGVTVNSFNAVSLEPALVLWSLSLNAWSMPVFRQARGFAVNILSQAQDDLCKLFASRVEDRFTGLEWARGLDGLPILPGNVATLECRTWACYPGGDHEIFVGEVLDCASKDVTPLVYCQGQLGALALE